MTMSGYMPYDAGAALEAKDAEITRLRAELAGAKRIASEMAIESVKNAARFKYDKEIEQLRAALAEAKNDQELSDRLRQSVLELRVEAREESERLRTELRIEKSAKDQVIEMLDKTRTALAEAERETNEHGKREVEAWAQRDQYMESDVKLVQMVKDERAEADLAAALETIRKLRSAENMTCVWHIASAFLERTATGADPGPARPDPLACSERSD